MERERIAELCQKVFPYNLGTMGEDLCPPKSEGTQKSLRSLVEEGVAKMQL